MKGAHLTQFSFMKYMVVAPLIDKNVPIFRKKDYNSVFQIQGSKEATPDLPRQKHIESKHIDIFLSILSIYL